MSTSPQNLQDPPVAGQPGSPIVLPATLLITDARSFAEGLREAVRQGHVAVDASRLNDIDTAGLQLLLATRVATQAAGHEFRWTAESAGLRTAAAATGLTQALGLAA
jgi:anti-anti-sigma regulatory factor